jgi:hypothetical protein
MIILRAMKVLILCGLVLVNQGILLSQGIIIDHTCTDITKIPDSWINKVKSQLRCITPTPLTENRLPLAWTG